MNPSDGKLRTHCDTNRQNVYFFASPATNGSGLLARCGSTDLAGGPTAL